VLAILDSPWHSFCVGLAFIAGGVFVVPRKYRAHAKIWVTAVLIVCGIIFIFNGFHNLHRQ